MIDDVTNTQAGIALGNDPGLVNRGLNWLNAHYENLAQDDPRYSTYMSFSEGTVVPLVRALGEVGNLSETEINKGLNLIPKVWDTERVARNKLNNLKTLMDNWIEKGVDEEDDMAAFMRDSGLGN